MEKRLFVFPQKHAKYFSSNQFRVELVSSLFSEEVAFTEFLRQYGGGKIQKFTLTQLFWQK